MAFPHPSGMIDRELTNVIRHYVPIAEKQGMLTQEQLALVYQHNWFKILVPHNYNGLEMSLPDVVRLEEALSWADGSMGWVVTLCAGACWFAGFMEPENTTGIFKDPLVCFAGSGAVTGKAIVTNGGYIVTGKWMHASGAPAATHFTANCFVVHDGKELMDESGKPIVLSFIFLREEVTVIPSWPAIGLIATASYQFEVTNQFVPDNRTLKIHSDHATHTSPLYHYPFMQLAEVTLAANICGMAIHFMDICQIHFSEKKNSSGTALLNTSFVSDTFEKVKMQLFAARNAMLEQLDRSWNICASGNDIDADILTRVSASAHALSDISRNTVDTLYPFCGLTAANPATEINRVWRDVHTCSQHTLLAFGKNR